MTTVTERLKLWARVIKKDVMTLWFAYRHPETPILAKALAIATAAYALSPIDLIPDFVPILGYLDDLIILPIMIYLTVRLIPKPVLAECRQQAEEWFAARREKPKTYGGAVAIVVLWVVLLGLAVWALLH